MGKVQPSPNLLKLVGKKIAMLMTKEGSEFGVAYIKTINEKDLQEFDFSKFQLDIVKQTKLFLNEKTKASTGKKRRRGRPKKTQENVEVGADVIAEPEDKKKRRFAPPDSINLPNGGGVNVIAGEEGQLVERQEGTPKVEMLCPQGTKPKLVKKNTMACEFD